MDLVAILGAGLIDPDKKDEVIIFLMNLPIPDRRKKQALIEWCNITGVVLTKEMVDKLLKRV